MSVTNISGSGFCIGGVGNVELMGATFGFSAEKVGGGLLRQLRAIFAPPMAPVPRGRPRGMAANYVASRVTRRPPARCVGVWDAEGSRGHRKRVMVGQLS